MYSIANKRHTEHTAHPTKYPQQYFKDKECRKCSTVFKPNAPSHLYCSQQCADVALQDKYLMRNYNLTLDDYLKMLEKQNNLCLICNEEGFIMDKAKHKLKLVVDHNHETGVVRGLLCHNCNRGLGLFKDKVSVIQKAINYLERK